MKDSTRNIFASKYCNPVFPQSFPDPFVLKFRGEYFAYCTGDWTDGRVFGVLHSRNLVDWTEIGGAMTRLDSNAPFYWAPEVTYSNGKFYLYYSVGNEALMELRVAVSERPDGGFVDAGVKLTNQDFAIDAHVFTDDSGEKYLFYATDFLRHSHIGTGTVVDKMTDFYTLENRPRPVTRAKYDWQVYDPNRIEKGGVRWHTIEGSFVLKHKGIYYQMFSGGNWQNITYGVSFAITDDISREEEWLQFSDGEKVLPILRTIPDLAVGPGHNSVVRGTNNRELYCVYHRWTENGRTLSIDRQDFAGTRIFIEGASFTEKDAPLLPTFADFFDGEKLNENWQPNGNWKVSDGEVFNENDQRSELVCTKTAQSFLCEFGFRAIRTANESGAFGFVLSSGTGKIFEFSVTAKTRIAKIHWFENGEEREEFLDLPEDFNFEAIHLLRVETDYRLVKIKLDEAVLNFEKLVEKIPHQIALIAENAQAAFSGFALTAGFEDLLEWNESELPGRGWQLLNDNGICQIVDKQMILTNESDDEFVITKGETAANFEYAVNLRLLEDFGENAAFGFLFLDENDSIALRLSLLETEGKFHFAEEKSGQNIALPEAFTPDIYHQFRFLKCGEKLRLQSEGIELGEYSVSTENLRIAIFCRNTSLALDLLRLTVL